MSRVPLKSRNHFVPRSYLKRWSGDDGKVATYRLLVPTDRAPLWKRFSLKSVAFHEHLYTTVVAGGESDGIERWLDAEFESPAEDSIRRVVSGRRLSREDWSCLIRFLAAQDARTPARLEATLARNDKWLPEVLERTLAKLARTQGTEEHAPETRLVLPEELRSVPVPFRVSVRPSTDGGGAQIVAEAINGRALWLMGVRRALTGPPIKVLLGHRWTILRPPEGQQFLTSDNPVVRLNYRNVSDYNLEGGWGVPGTNILLPLSPEHLLFTEIGRTMPLRGERLDPVRFEFLQRVIIENAYRQVFAANEEAEVERVRPRIVDTAQVAA